MHMLFVDESGTPPAPGKSGYFVLGGVIVPDGMWSTLEAKLNTTKAKYRIRGEIKWRHFAPSNNKPDNPLSALTMAARRMVRTELLGHLTSMRSIKLLAVVTDAARAYNVGLRDADELYHFAYKPMTERFQYFLQDLSRESGVTTQGIIVADHRGPRDDRRLRDMHERLLHRNGPTTSDYKNLVEGLFIAPSDSSVGIQFADLVAGSVFRAYNGGDRTCLEQIKPAFRTDPKTGSIMGYGLVHQPKWQ